jgi:hypothetical protein
MKTSAAHSCRGCMKVLAAVDVVKVTVDSIA